MWSKKWKGLDSGNKSRVLNPDDPFVMSVRKNFGQSCFASVDNDFGLSEDDTSDQEGVGISWDTIIDLDIALSMNKVVAPEQPSNVTILSILMKDEEDTSEEESSLVVSVS